MSESFVSNVVRKILLVVFVLAAMLIIIGFIFPLNQRVTLPGGGSLRLHEASFWAALAGTESLSRSTVTYGSKPGTVIFWQDWCDEPSLVFPAKDGHSFFCLYNWDTSEPLLKIDTSRGFKGSDNWIVKAIVLSSSWHVDRATLADWEEAEAYITTNSARNEYLLSEVRKAIDNMRHGRPSIQYGGDASESVDPK